MTEMQEQFNLKNRKERYEYLCELTPIDPIFPVHPSFAEFTRSEQNGLVLISSSQDRVVISDHGTFQRT